MSARNFIRKGSYIDLDYVFGTLCNQDAEYPLDYQSMKDNPMEYIVLGTNAITGEPHYFTKDDIRKDCFDIIKASSCIPFICKPYHIDGVPFYDGALGDTIPIEKAFAMGCEKVILLLSKPEGEIRNAKKDTPFAKMIRRKYPKASEQLMLRAKKYNDGVALAKKYAKQGKLLIVSPDDTCGVDTLTKKKASLEELYRKGYANGKRIKEFLDQTIIDPA